ncbi:Conserved_hypothetical protein [Hexamita inflata]|uniref:Uncharacterized protein n=1 Tax=Hexamita inflata TaxID=28002 RepID=A0ABP1JYS2_9EUKA
MNKIQVQDFYPSEHLNFDVTSPQIKRFYGKVKRIGNLWVTPDGQQFQKQHLAYKSVHDSHTGHQLNPLYIPEGMSLEQFFDIKLQKVINSHYQIKFSEVPMKNGKFVDIYDMLGLK